MSNYSKIYWLTRLDAIHTVFAVALIAVCMGLFIYIMTTSINAEFNSDKENEAIRKRYRWLRVTGRIAVPVCVLVLALLPSRNEAILIMVGGKTLDYAQTDTSLSKLPYQTTAYISQYMENALRELKKD